MQVIQPSPFRAKIPTSPNYEIDFFGNVFKDGILVPSWIGTDKYLYARINGIPKAIHRLVLLSFKGDPPTKDHQACHQDGNRLNNCPTNLRWGTRQENIADKKRHGTIKKKPGVNGTKLTTYQIKKIRELASKKCPREKIAKKFNISLRNVYRIISGEYWPEVGIPTSTPKKKAQESKYIQLEIKVN